MQLSNMITQLRALKPGKTTRYLNELTFESLFLNLT